MYIELAKNYSILNDRLAELRSIEFQNDRSRFRENIRMAGQILAYELSKHLASKTQAIQTPLGIHSSKILNSEAPVMATILRAGLNVHEGMLDVFKNADCAFVSAYRKYNDNNQFEIVVEYLATPDINNRILIICDPMLATGKSMVLAYQTLLSKGTPAQVWIASVIGSRQGVDYVQKHIPNAHIIIGDVDEHLNEHAYIVPGLGDAGDLCYGPKL